MGNKIFFIALLSTFLFSCSNSNNLYQYYQVYKTNSIDNIKNENNQYIFENQDCKIVYDLREDYGKVKFEFHNKTNKNIYIQLDNSFLIADGKAFDYFKNNEITNTRTESIYNSYKYEESIGLSEYRGVGASKKVYGINYYGLPQTNMYNANVSQTANVKNTNTYNTANSNTKGYSITTISEKIVCVPPNSYKNVQSFSIVSNIYEEDCTFYKYPSRKNIKTLDFDKNNSPFKFTNRIAYKVGDNNTLISFDNNFFVSKITNYPESEVIEYKTDKDCNQKETKYKVIKNMYPDMFYIRYFYNPNVPNN